MIYKKDVIQLLETIALYMELKGENPFKISAFRKAAGALESDERSLAEMDDVTKLKGIGKGTAAVIKEFMSTGQSAVLEELKQEIPETLLPLLKLPGLGGKKVDKLYHELGVADIETLKLACEKNMVQELAGFGKKTEEKIMAAILEFGTRPERLPIASVSPLVGEIEGVLAKFVNVDRFSVAGSFRRMRETVRDLDFIISTDDATSIKEQLLTLPNIKEIIASGETKVSLVIASEYDVPVDFRIVTPAQFATTLHHFTGSKDHNIRMRQLAKEQGERISEYGVENLETGETFTFASEQAFFAHFGLPFIPAEVREDGKEVDLITPETQLIQLEDMKGDLHMHTTWSDGSLSVAELVEMCYHRGYQFIAITDHSKYLQVANGLNEERLIKQKVEIEKARQKYPDFTILHGTEMDILPDGTLDFSDDILKQLDFVIASIHSSFNQTREEIMQRMENAMRNPYVHMIAHPTGRIIGHRDGYDVDIDRLIALAVETGTILELNSNPHRLDLSAAYVKKAQEAGAKIAINTDAHDPAMLIDMKLGVATARKGWITADNVVNTWDKDRFLHYLKNKELANSSQFNRKK